MGLPDDVPGTPGYWAPEPRGCGSGNVDDVIGVGMMDDREGDRRDDAEPYDDDDDLYKLS